MCTTETKNNNMILCSEGGPGVHESTEYLTGE